MSKLPETTQAWLRQTAKFEGSVTAQVLLHLLERMDAQEQRSVPGTVKVAAPTPEAAPVAAPAEALAARPLLEKMARLGDCIGQQTVAQVQQLAEQAAAWLRDNPPGQPVAIEPRGCPAPGACSCVEPTPEPTPEAAPEATDNGLVRCYAQAVEDALKAGHGIDGAAAAGLRALYDLGRQHDAAQPPAPQPAPVAAAIRAALERLVKLYNDDTHALLGSDWGQAFAAACAALAQPPAPQPTPPAAPAGGLVDEICRQLAIRRGEVRAVIRLVAAALLEWHRSDEVVHTAWEAAKWLEQEADR